MRTGDERKLVSILFADLVGSTAYAGDRDPERVRYGLERFYAAMREEIERTGGTVEKFAGDAVMAVYGAPVALEDHVERALHAALAMQRRTRDVFGGELQLRPGVNTDEVVVALSREDGSFVTGDAVNVADRLQKAAEPGEVLVGLRTACWSASTRSSPSASPTSPRPRHRRSARKERSSSPSRCARSDSRAGRRAARARRRAVRRARAGLAPPADREPARRASALEA